MNNIYNKMQQPIMYKGQLSIGDEVSCSSGWSDPDFEVFDLDGDEGEIRGLDDDDITYIKFIDGKGWVWN